MESKLPRIRAADRTPLVEALLAVIGEKLEDKWTLKDENQELKDENRRLKDENEKLEDSKRRLEGKNQRLEDENSRLKKRLEQYEPEIRQEGNRPGTVSQQGWQLDATGNWKNFTQFDPNNSVSTLDQDRTANAFNEITGITNTVGAQWATPTYDRNGNTKTIPKPDNLVEGLFLTYDAWNRLTVVKSGAGLNVVGYKYDGQNWRTAELTYGSTGTLNETRDLFYSAGWQVLEERVNGASTAATQYIWGLRYIDDCVLRDRSVSGSLDERRYAMQDANWNMVAIADTAGAVQERYGYTPYGVLTVYDPSWNVRGGSAFDWRYLFQSGRFEAPIGMYYFRNRDYLPILGCWIQRDPIVNGAGERNLWRYANNNPLNLVDPFGQDPESLMLQFIPNASITIDKNEWSPTVAENGAYSWKVEFQLVKNGKLVQPTDLSGAIIQKVTYLGEITARKNNKDTTEQISFFYWEAWAFSRPLNAIDTFAAAGQPCTKGNVRVVGEAVYFNEFNLKNNGFSSRNKTPAYIPKFYKDAPGGLPVRWGEDVEKLDVFNPVFWAPPDWKKLTKLYHSVELEWNNLGGKTPETKLVAKMGTRNGEKD